MSDTIAMQAVSCCPNPGTLRPSSHTELPCLSFPARCPGAVPRWGVGWWQVQCPGGQQVSSPPLPVTVSAAVGPWGVFTSEGQVKEGSCLRTPHDAQSGVPSGIRGPQAHNPACVCSEQNRHGGEDHTEE